jgi:2-C-methyl-D-erythritol 2,4-cyclodiphosphate synthase
MTMGLEWLHLKRLPVLRIGIGFDAHEFKKGRRLILGGVVIPGETGLSGHSDADVLLHAVTDALLGAMALPDIGTFFPDTDPNLAGADSGKLLTQALKLVKGRGYLPVTVDTVLVCDRPKVAPYAAALRRNLARLLGLSLDCVGLKAKTTEGTRLAIPGRSIAAIATVQLRRR